MQNFFLKTDLASFYSSTTHLGTPTSPTFSDNQTYVYKCDRVVITREGYHHNHNHHRQPSTTRSSSASFQHLSSASRSPPVSSVGYTGGSVVITQGRPHHNHNGYRPSSATQSSSASSQPRSSASASRSPPVGSLGYKSTNIVITEERPHHHHHHHHKRYRRSSTRRSSSASSQYDSSASQPLPISALGILSLFLISSIVFLIWATDNGM